MIGNLHNSKLTARLASNARKGRNTLLVGFAAGMGRTYLLEKTARGLQLWPDKLTVIQLAGAKGKREVTALLYHGTFDRRCSASEHAVKWALHGGRDKLASVEKAWQELHDRKLLIVVDDIDILDVGALEVLATLAALPNVSFLLSLCTVKKPAERTKTFLNLVKCDVQEMTPLPDKAINALYMQAIQRRNLTDDKWTRVRCKVVKAARGLPGALHDAIEALSHEDTAEGFNERLALLARQSVRTVYWDDGKYLILIAVGGMGYAIFTHATSAGNVFRIATATLCGAVALGAYRVILNKSQTTNPWD